MRREERAWSSVGTAVKVFDDGPRDREAVVGGRTAPDFVEDDKRAIRGVVQDVRGLVHLDHEGRVAAGEVVARPDAGKDAIDQSDAAGLGRRPAADLSEQSD